MNLNDVIKKIKTIDIQTKGWVNSIFSGAYHSRFKGQGIHFSDVREYCYGDDVRRIDWTVTAKLNKPYIKEFEEERDYDLKMAQYKASLLEGLPLATQEYSYATPNELSKALGLSGGIMDLYDIIFGEDKVSGLQKALEDLGLSDEYEIVDGKLQKKTA